MTLKAILVLVWGLGLVDILHGQQVTLSPSPVPSSASPTISAKSSPPSTTISPSGPSFHPSASMDPLESTAPSDFPSLVPSISPSTNRPSQQPTLAPTTNQPTTGPSWSPSLMPSYAPSSLPSISPTDPPTPNPTISPSSAPSDLPTNYCHDVANYRSPINGFTCSDHIGTDCTQWRYLGLSVDEVEALIENCPISCSVECGSTSRFATIFSFKLWNIDTFLSPSAVLAMDDVAIDFMTEYISKKEPQGKFFLDETVLISQKFADNQQSRYLRGLQEEYTSRSLHIDLEFRGFAIGLDRVTIDSRLRDALFSSEFTLALQRSGDLAFTNARVDVLGSVRPVPPETRDSEEGVSPGGITAAILSSLAVTAAVSVFVYKYKQKSGGKKDAKPEPNTVFNNFPLSPNHSVVSRASSFSVARIVASLSPRSAEDDENATQSAEYSSSESDESATRDNALTNVHMPLDQDTIDEGDENETTEDEEEAGSHPYAGIIPPMIVIDCIENNPAGSYMSELATSTNKIKMVVPSMRLEASSDLVAALGDRTRPFNPEQFASFIQNNKPVAVEEVGFQEMNDYLQNDGERGDSFNLFSSEDDGETVGDSTTCSILDTSDALFDRLRKGNSLDNDEIVDTCASKQEHRAWHPFVIPPMARPPRVPSEGSQRNSPKSAHSSPVIHRQKSTSDGYLSDDAAAKEQILQSRKEGPSFLHSLWNKSPHSKNPPSSSSKSDSLGESLRRWGAHRRSNSRGSHGTSTSLDEHGTLLTFHAPKGKLGLVLECSTESSPIIAKVKDYSPLLDQVLPGDKIVMIENTFTKNMGMREVMGLLEGKSSRPTSIRLKILRANSDSLDGSSVQHIHARSPTASNQSLDGTGSLGTTSDLDSPIHSAKKSTQTAQGSSNASLSAQKLVPMGGMKRSQSDTNIVE